MKKKAQVLNDRYLCRRPQLYMCVFRCIQQSWIQQHKTFPSPHAGQAMIRNRCENFGDGLCQESRNIKVLEDYLQAHGLETESHARPERPARLNLICKYVHETPLTSAMRVSTPSRGYVFGQCLAGILWKWRLRASNIVGSSCCPKLNTYRSQPAC